MPDFEVFESEDAEGNFVVESSEENSLAQPTEDSIVTNIVSPVGRYVY